jgi:hypothetical protein
VSPHLVITEPAALADGFARAAAGIARLDPSADVLLAELATGRTQRTRAHLRADNVEPRVAARYCAWTADIATITAIWPALRERVIALMRDTAVPGRALMCAELERTATDVGDAQLAAELHRCARTATGEQRHIMNDDPRTILDIVHDVVGAEPDAVRGRLRLRPRLPVGARSLALHGLAFADGDVSLRVRRDDDGIVCNVEQDAGALPFTVLLEPYIDGDVRATRIDGLPARLDTRALDDGRVVPVQLVLEQQRTLEIDLART